jgi:hypothetical protein
MGAKLFDRSRVTTDWKCRRRRYYNYEHNGAGITSGSAAYELYFGILVHDALAAIATFHLKGEVPIDDIASQGAAQLREALILQNSDAQEYALEQAALFEGMIRGFYRFQWPRILSSYPEIIVVEQEVVTPYGFMVKPDLICAASDGTLVYVEYKTTSSKNDKWIASWETNPQLHAYLKAIRDAHKIEVRAALVIGLYKGYDYKGRQTTPFCYAHARIGSPPFFETEFSYAYKAGFRKTPVWELPEGVKGWVDAMPDPILAEQFVEVDPIYLNEGIADAFFRQAAIREGEIAQGMKFIKDAKDPDFREAILDGWFAQNFEACRPGWGSHCPYAAICIDGVSPDDPMWQPREPHHSSEAEAKDEQV